MLLLLTLLLWIGTAIRYGGFDSCLPLSYRLQAAPLSLIFVLLGANGIDLFWWGVVHPNAFISRFQISSGFFSPQVAVGIVAVCSLIAHVELAIAYRIAQRNLKGFSYAVLFAPFLLVINLLDYTRSIQKYAGDSHKLVYLYAIGFPFIIALYVWLYWFAKNPKNRQFIHNESASTVQTNDSPLDLPK